MNYLMLAKFQKSDYIEDMYENEYLFFSNPKSFRNNKKDVTGRNDPRELNMRNEVLTSLAVNSADKSAEFNHKQLNRKWQYVEHPKNPNINICSLYTIEAQLDSPIPEVDSRMVEENDSTLLIWDRKTFFNILDHSLESSGYEYSRKLVTYYDPEECNGKLTPHHKDEYFDFQKEYRIVVGPTDADSVNISIPGLKEISTVLDSSKLETLIVKA